MGCPIEVISGIEEARLIYLGVSHTLASDSERRLVIDIGGGSTEFIVGERFEPLELESLEMGCVSFTKRYFNDGLITEKKNFSWQYLVRYGSCYQLSVATAARAGQTVLALPVLSKRYGMPVSVWDSVKTESPPQH